MKIKVLNAQTQLEIREIDLPETMAKHGECLFGRSPNSALVLDSPDVSRMHGKFLLDQGQYYFYDLGSANGSTINGQLAQANHRYSLKSGDIIRVGEFVLLLHEVMPEELPATVIGDPNATIVNDLQFDRIMSFVQESQPASVDTDKLDTIKEISVTSEANDLIIEPSFTEVAEELVEALQDEPSESSVLEAPEEKISSTQLAIDPVVEDAVTSELGERTIESKIAEAPLLVELDFDKFIEDSPEEVSSELEVAEPITAETPTIDTDSTVIQLAEDESIGVTIDEVPSPVAESIAIDNLTPAPETASVENVQSVLEESPPSLEDDPWADPLPGVHSSQSEESLAQPTIDEASAEQVEAVPKNATVIQSSELSEQVESISESEALPVEESVTVDQDLELLEQPDTELEEPVNADATVIQSSELLEQPDTELEEPVNADATVIQSSEPIEQPVTAELEESAIETSNEAHEDTTVVQSSGPVELVSTLAAQSASTIEETASPTVTESAAHLTPVASEESEQPEPTIADSADAQVPVPSIQKSQIISTKYIALLAHDSQIEALNQLVHRYQDLFGYCKTIATPTLSEALLKSSGISVSQQTPAVSAGGYQTLNGLITSDQVLAVIFLRDFLTPQPTQVNDEALSRSCNVYRVLFATNAPTAEAILHYIQTVVAVA